jgi:uncharacterized protein (TIGR02271 family)
LSRTIIALFDSLGDADAAIANLVQAGFDRTSIETLTHSSTAAGAETQPSFLTRMLGWNIPEDDAGIFDEGVRRGGVLLRLTIEEIDAERAIGVLDRSNAVDIDERGQTYLSEGWTARHGENVSLPTSVDLDRAAQSDPNLGPAAEAFRDANLAPDPARTKEEVIPVVEERLAIGKRDVHRGTVRVRSYVTEAPVTQQVHLRDERVTIERRSVDRPVGGDAFQEHEIEATETAEEPVVQKQARVTEEVVVRKEADERTRTVSDTVRRTEVEIDDDRNPKKP